MARNDRFRLLTVLALLAVPFTPTVLAQGHEPSSAKPEPTAPSKEAPATEPSDHPEPPPPPPPHHHPHREKPRVFGDEKMTPEQREKFEKNFKRWRELPPERRRELRQHDEHRRKRMRREIDEAIHKSGLDLSPERRRLFAEKFTRERRVIEEKLRKELEQKRAEEVMELLEGLVGEFKAMPPEKEETPVTPSEEKKSSEPQPTPSKD
jgi:Spy/CpxP family protein refolding chaperone